MSHKYDSGVEIQQDGAGGPRVFNIFSHLLHSYTSPTKEHGKRCSEKLTCTVQMDTPSFLTRRLRKLKKYESSRKRENTRFSWHAVPKTTVCYETYIYVWKVKLNYIRQSNGWCKRNLMLLCVIWKKKMQKLLQTFMGLSISPPHRDCRLIRKGLQVGFKLFFTTW